MGKIDRLLLLAFAGCFLLERMTPGWNLPAIKSWPWRALAINAIQLGVVVLAGISWEHSLAGGSAFHLSRHLNAGASGLRAYFLATFVFYWWHRWRHEVDWLWRVFHQIHHSPRRLEVITWWDMAFGTYENPTEWLRTCGFDAAREEQLLPMLAFRDVHQSTEPQT